MTGHKASASAKSPSAIAMAWQRAWPAPAKINRFLHVVGRRADGYHLLQTVFQFVDVADVLRFTPLADGEIRLATPLPGVPPDADLTVRAARLLQLATGCRQGARIAIDKHLPMGGGLGGGSSDAATVLLALNHLWQTGLTRTELQALGLQLGADVPVFIHGRTTFAEGVGERFTDVQAPGQWVLIAVPNVSVPTAAIFGDAALRRDTPAITASEWHPEFGGNDLEAVAAQRFPAVAQCLAALRCHGPARMSGSGASCFALFDNEATAHAAASRLHGDLGAGLRTLVAPTLTEHPLLKI